MTADQRAKCQEPCPIVSETIKSIKSQVDGIEEMIKERFRGIRNTVGIVVTVAVAIIVLVAGWAVTAVSSATEAHVDHISDRVLHRTQVDINSDDEFKKEVREFMKEARTPLGISDSQKAAK